MKTNTPLPYDTPENLGIPAQAICNFVKRLQSKKLPMHSVMVLRHGKTAAEIYWKPYGADALNRLYSCSKSYVAIAIGCLQAEGKLDINDPVVKFFPDKAPADLHPYIAQTTLRDLLMMATPHLFAAVTYGPKDPDWADTFFNTPPTHIPGKIFSYDTTATTILAIIAERLAEKPFIEYLRPIFLDAMGCSADMKCIETPCGYSWGGSGVLATTRDFAKFALLVMNSGKHEGRQLLPADYVREATSRQIDSSTANYEVDHIQGYGYQFWRTTRNGFACFGMGSQFAICLPDKDFILITTADTQGNLSGGTQIFDALWDELYPELADGALDPNPTANQELASLTQDLSLPLVEGSKHSPVIERINGKCYTMTTPGELEINRIRCSFKDDIGTIEYSTPRGHHTLSFGFGFHHQQRFPESGFSGIRISTPKPEGYDCHSSAAWVSNNSLAIVTHLTDDHIGNLRINLAFDDAGETITIMMTKAAEWFLDGYTGFISGHVEKE